MADKKWFIERNDNFDRRLAMWVRRLRGDQFALAEALPLRRDITTLLTYVRDNRAKGTQSTGNLKLKDVRAVTARFVDPPVLDHTIGDRVYKLRTEYDVWPLYFLHVLAEVGGLLEGGPSRLWRLTSIGEKFLNAIPPAQVWFMLTIWWRQVNWLIAYPVSGLGESLPPRLGQVTLAHLLSLPANTRITYERFADRLIEESGLTWTAPDISFARSLLHGAVRKIVIDVMADFGILEREYREKPLGKGAIQELVAFRVTPFGKGLLGAL